MTIVDIAFHSAIMGVKRVNVLEYEGSVGELNVNINVNADVERT